MAENQVLTDDDPQGDATIAELIAGGMTPQEVAKALGVTRARVDSVPFAIGSNHVSRVEAALLDRAIGSTVFADRLTRSGDVVRLETQLPADVPAAKTILEARDPDRWARRQGDDVRVVLVGLSDMAARVGVTYDAQPLLSNAPQKKSQP